MNIVKNPTEEKFRTIHLSNQAIQSRLLSAQGSLEFLVAAGFVQVDDTMIYLEQDVSLIVDAVACLERAHLACAPVAPAQPPPAQTETTESRERQKYLAELREKKRKEDAEKAALRQRLAAQREEQKNRVVRDSNAALLKGRSKGTTQSATEMGCDGSAGGG
eukprot:TRINITY_DN1565_c0_g1_i10.p1 TRINITY_DN1565_c0_g1~~TRINITY_DN1565_c0_g1_i10.p1  ORF type:complete len:162 (+),score=45.32 TRINITY_DN1565_c0_g1_i10:132-617(+)